MKESSVGISRKDNRHDSKCITASVKKENKNNSPRAHYNADVQLQFDAARVYGL